MKPRPFRRLCGSYLQGFWNPQIASSVARSISDFMILDESPEVHSFRTFESNSSFSEFTVLSSHEKVEQDYLSCDILLTHDLSGTGMHDRDMYTLGVSI